jgi:ethanolamine utilization protein EutA
MRQELISVGIDVGTSTTHVIFSRLVMADSGGFSVPRADIVSREILYRGEIRETPLVSPEEIDAPALTAIVAGEFERAGFGRRQVDTGAVIITGESARKENARPVLEGLSAFAGDFVVSTAGPDLEAIISGRGSGAADWSLRNSAAAVNLDIGGGTTNIACFAAGEAESAGSLDIGGRLVRVRDGRISRVSPPAMKVADWKGIPLREGDAAGEASLGALCIAMAEVLEMALDLRPAEPILEQLRTPGSSPFKIRCPPDASFLSGGVADAVYGGGEEPFAYGDIGVLLGRSIKRSAVCTGLPLRRGGETIRATVVGAGNYTVSLSGSTIFYRGPVFPRRNLPVLRLSPREEAACFKGDDGPLSERIRWFLAQHDAEELALAMTGRRNPGFEELGLLADVIVRAAAALPQSSPLVVITEEDMAKALGQFIASRSGRPAAVLDSLRLKDHVYIDLGPPVMDGIAAPVVIKTLIFG